MKKNIIKIKNLFKRWIGQIFNPLRFLLSFPRYLSFFMEWAKYSKISGAEKINLLDIYPCIHDKTQFTDFNKHYFYQDIWAFRKIYESQSKHHIDIASRVDFAGFLSVITKVTFIDIRPAEIKLKDFESKKGDILDLPFADNCIPSLSCLSVVEHIGVGRYDDALNPRGTEKACRELARVLAKDGNLYLSVPVGEPKLYFNSHRVPSFEQIREYFKECQLMEFSGIDEEGNFIENIDIKNIEKIDFKEGLFWFKKNN